MGHFIRTSSIILSFFIVLTLFNSCKEKQKKKSEPPTVEAQKSNEKQVLQIVRSYVSKTKMTVSKQSYYYQLKNKRVPCDQYDIDAGKNCTEKSSTAPFGYKTARRGERVCCKEKIAKVGGIKGEWKTSYSNTNDQWKVELEFKDDANKKRNLFWTVNDNNLEVKEPNN